VWVTLVTRSTYLPGAILLAYRLKKHQLRYPLVIFTTSTLSNSYLPAFQQERILTNSRYMQVKPLLAPANFLPEKLIAPRFEDTWTNKLRVFELHKYGCERLVFLDGDMLVRRNMDELFDLELPRRNWFAANHACPCNLDHDSWAPSNWNRENCAGWVLTAHRRLYQLYRVSVERERTAFSIAVYSFSRHSSRSGKIC
jgi:hypothetical protein